MAGQQQERYFQFWSKLQHGTHRRSSLAVVNNLLTLIGGDCDEKTTNKLFSLTRRSGMTRWTELLPPMPTKRWSASSLCTATLIVVEGVGDEHVLAVTEVMNTESRQWSTVIDLAEPMYFGSLICTNDQIYVIGRCNKYMKHIWNQPILIHWVHYFKLVTWRVYCKITVIHQTWCCVEEDLLGVLILCIPTCSTVTASNWWLGFTYQNHLSCSCVIRFI